MKISEIYYIFFPAGTNERIAEPITLEATNKLYNISGKIFVMKNGPDNEKAILKLQQDNSQAVIVLSAVLSKCYNYDIIMWLTCF